jgi:hypothetical protein
VFDPAIELAGDLVHRRHSCDGCRGPPVRSQYDCVQ